MTGPRGGLGQRAWDTAPFRLPLRQCPSAQPAQEGLSHPWGPAQQTTHPQASPSPSPRQRWHGPGDASGPASAPSEVVSEKSQGRRAEGWQHEWAPPSLPLSGLCQRHTLPAFSTRGRAGSGPPQRSDQGYPRQGAQPSTAPKWETGPTPNQIPGSAGKWGAPAPTLTLFGSPVLQASPLSRQRDRKPPGRGPSPAGMSQTHLLTALPAEGETSAPKPGSPAALPDNTRRPDNCSGCSLGPDLGSLNQPWGCQVCGHHLAVCLYVCPFSDTSAISVTLQDEGCPTAPSTPRRVAANVHAVLPAAIQTLQAGQEPAGRGPDTQGSPVAVEEHTPRRMQRSEERRVGKECLRLCRSRWSPYH